MIKRLLILYNQVNRALKETLETQGGWTRYHIGDLNQYKTFCVHLLLVITYSYTIELTCRKGHYYSFTVNRSSILNLPLPPSYLPIDIRAGLTHSVFNHTWAKIKWHIIRSLVHYSKIDTPHIDHHTWMGNITLTGKIDSECLFPQMIIKHW